MKDNIKYLRYHLDLTNGRCHPLKKKYFLAYRKNFKGGLLKKTSDGISTIYYYWQDFHFFCLVVVDLAKSYLL